MRPSHSCQTRSAMSTTGSSCGDQTACPARELTTLPLGLASPPPSACSHKFPKHPADILLSSQVLGFQGHSVLEKFHLLYVASSSGNKVDGLQPNLPFLSPCLSHAAHGRVLSMRRWMRCILTPKLHPQTRDGAASKALLLLIRYATAAYFACASTWKFRGSTRCLKTGRRASTKFHS